MIFLILGHLSTSKHILVILICNVGEAYTFSGICRLMSLRILDWVLNEFVLMVLLSAITPSCSASWRSLGAITWSTTWPPWTWPWPGTTPPTWPWWPMARGSTVRWPGTSWSWRSNQQVCMNGVKAKILNCDLSRFSRSSMNASSISAGAALWKDWFVFQSTDGWKMWNFSKVSLKYLMFSERGIYLGGAADWPFGANSKHLTHPAPTITHFLENYIFKGAFSNSATIFWYLAFKWKS